MHPKAITLILSSLYQDEYQSLSDEVDAAFAQWQEQKLRATLDAETKRKIDTEQPF